MEKKLLSQFKGNNSCTTEYSYTKAQFMDFKLMQHRAYFNSLKTAPHEQFSLLFCIESNSWNLG